MTRYTFTTQVWLYPGMAGWHFASVPEDVSAKIKKSREGLPRIGWGSVPVTATIGNTSWKSSIFPDKKSGTYLLPLKAEIRKKEGIAADDTITLTLEL
ncbi:MAG TPA: DUF1905 domain-containing protein [Candidatus Paceibacterota bacterium]|nr:DUF1905 domain-containing protein [Candidatus Paceibacterota bacterium]